MVGNKNQKKQIVFLILPTVQMLDLAGPVQAFDEAIEHGAGYQLRYVAPVEAITSSQQLTLSDLAHFRAVDLRAGDLLVIPGIHGNMLGTEELDKLGEHLYQWLQEAHKNGAKLCTVCNAAFVLAHAGLLDNRSCTTHWKRVDQLKESYPAIDVLDNRLFVKDGNIYTSAGITSGIDLALSIIEDDYGPAFTARIAKELVVYMRRDGTHGQLSTYLDYRGHLNPGIHNVQDWLANNPDADYSLESLARIAGMSTRNLTRLFKKVTGITIKVYATRLKLELAATLMNNPKLTIETISKECGFEDARHFRRLWKTTYGVSPSESRAALSKPNFLHNQSTSVI